MRAIPSLLTVDEIVPLIEALTPEERVRLLRLIASQPGDDPALYRAMPPAKEEFSPDEDPLARFFRFCWWLNS